MKARSDFILRRVAGETILIPVGEAALSVKGMIGLTESAGMCYEMLQAGCTREDLLAALLREYDVSEAQASADLDEMLAQMRKLKILEE